MNPQRLWQYAQDLHWFKPDKIPGWERGPEHKGPPLTKELFAKIISVFLNGVTLNLSTTLYQAP